MANGVSGTDPFGEGLSGYGSLKDFGVDDKYLKLAEAISGKPREIDPAMAAFLYFSKMGELASQPGATLFGSAAGAASSPAEYMMNIREQNRKREAEVPATAINLMKALKPPTAGTTTLNSYTLQKDIPGIGSKNDVVTLTNANAAKIINADPSALLEAPSTSTAGAKKPAPYSVSEEKLAELNATLGLNLQRSADGTVLLTPEQFAKSQSLVTGAPAKTPQGSQYERLFNSVNDIGTRLADPELASGVTAAEKNEYAANYQKLVVGGEYTEIVDGKEVTRTKPGIDLSSTTNLPIPDGLDLNKIIEERSQKFDQNQSTSATFGSRMLFNEGILRNMLASGYVLTVQDVAQIRTMQTLGLGNIGVTPEAQQFHVAAQNWVAAQLRNESGAAIAASEYADALLQYFPKVGDSPETIKQKQALREEATRGMINASGDAFSVIYPDGVKYLTYTSEGQEYPILNPQGYANEKLTRTELGQTLFFKDMIAAKTTQALKKMLANPKAKDLYTDQMIDMIAAELAKPERNP